MAKRKEVASSQRLPENQHWGAEVEEELLEKVKEAEAAFEDAMLRLSRYYSKSEKPQSALMYMERLLGSSNDPEKKAFCLLSMGQLMEQGRDYDGAMEYYKRAMMLEPANPCSWYFIHNNIGCCLNHLEEFEEAEQYCRDAIRVDPSRYNAYINLGVSLEGQEQFVEAARSFLEAIKADADDLELVQHLQCLVEEHQEIASGIADLEDALRAYRTTHHDEGFDEL